MQKQGEIIELVLGLGLLAWRTPSKGKSPAVLRHMVTARVDLHFDASTGIIRLHGAAGGAQLRVEDDMLEPELRPDRSHYVTVGDQLNLIGDDVWDRPSMSTALKSWAAALHADTEWSSDLKMATSSETKPMVSFAPALIMRKRSQVGMIRIYDALINRLDAETDEEVPSGWLSLVNDEDDQDTSELPAQPNNKSAASYLGSQEVFFPATCKPRAASNCRRNHPPARCPGPGATGDRKEPYHRKPGLSPTGQRKASTNYRRNGSCTPTSPKINFRRTCCLFA